MTTASATSSSARAEAPCSPTVSACRCSARCRSIPALREGGDDGRPITAVEPDSEAAQVFRAMAERIAVELAPTRKYRRELKII